MMAESPMVGARVPQEWLQHIQGIAAASTEAQIVREAIAAYLGQVTEERQRAAMLKAEGKKFNGLPDATFF
ncbi:MAG: hypothetical protein DSM106950_45590 [Stigonema ocellatum SAG 48.90 = DSM 106950]|nr:hypothetical protein [Stigonema ocellatum SAG 48.90 = DSM 106950]